MMKKTINRHFFQKIMPYYKKAILPIFSVCIAIAANAQVQPCLFPCDNKKINVIENFRQVEVRGEVTVILLPDAIAGELMLEGNPKDIDCVKTMVTGQKLIINAEKKKSFDKLTIYLPATGINSLILTGDAEVFSSGRIKVRDLEILLNGSSLLAMDYEGNVKVLAGEGYDMVDMRHRKK